MKKLVERFLINPAYPLLISIYPVLLLFTSNTYQVEFVVLLRPLFISILVGLLLFYLMKLAFHEWHTSAFSTTVILIFLFSYGHLVNLLENEDLRGFHIYFFTGWSILVILLIFLLAKIRDGFDFSLVAPYLNLAAIILLLYPLGKTVQNRIAISTASSITSADRQQSDISSPDLPPDIYYIIPDGYARSDVLKDAFNFDNSGFISELEKMGFYIPPCSQSNYPNTGLSLASTLNMDFIQNLGDHFKPDEKELLYLFLALENNSVKQILEDSGYKTIAFASGFSWAEMRDFDLFISPPYGPINEFEVMFLKTTIIRALDDFKWINLDNLEAERYRDRTRLVFESIPDIAKMPGPKFVFLHIIAPHPPFGFDQDGNSVLPDQVNDRDGYVSQAKFVNKKIIEAAQILMEQSNTPPIIIIQGDHGLYSSNREWQFGILNAYYLPNHDDDVYPTISPVNTFRMIFNQYFHAHYQYLPDDSYYSKLPYVYDFSLVGNKCTW